MRRKKFITPSYIHNNPRRKVENLKINSVILQDCSNGTYLQDRQWKQFLISHNLFAELVFKIGSLKLFSAKPKFGYCKMSKLRDLKPLSDISIQGRGFTGIVGHLNAKSTI